MNDYYNIETAKNTKNPDILRKILERGWIDWVSYYAAENKNCPLDILRKILERGLEFVFFGAEFICVSMGAAKNPNCPIDLLIKMLERKEDNWVSQNAASNPNCPFDAKLRWLENTGKIVKEDPKKHIIEYEEEKVDEDLETLKKMAEML